MNGRGFVQSAGLHPGPRQGELLRLMNGLFVES